MKTHLRQRKFLSAITLLLLATACKSHVKSVVPNPGSTDKTKTPDASSRAAPFANAQELTVPFNTTTAVTLTGTTDPTLTTVSYQILSAPAHGTLSGDGASRNFTPTAGYAGTDSFTFVVSDGTQQSEPATVTMNVGKGITGLHQFRGGSPYGFVPRTNFLASGNRLYAVTSDGYNSGGALISIGTDFTDIKNLHNFSGAANGYYPIGAPVEISDVLYGASANGGTGNNGGVYRINKDGSGFALIHQFNGGSEGGYPSGSLAKSGDVLYGMTTSYGGGSAGTIFKLNTDGTGYATLYSFTAGSDGGSPLGSLLYLGGKLYGTTSSGGSSGNGNIFRIDTDGANYTTLYSFNGTADGANPNSTLVGANGVLYGTVPGGTSGGGNIFRMAADGSGFTVLHNFTGGADGMIFASEVNGDLVLSDDGVLYGMTESNTIYKILIDGSSYSILRTFDSLTEASNPYGSLAIAGGRLYGLSANAGQLGYGSMMSLKIDGSDPKALLIENLCDGLQPMSGFVASASGDTLYGTTSSGGNGGAVWGLYEGSVYSIKPDGTDFKLIHSFTDGDGGFPQSKLTLVGSTLYGTTYGGNSSGSGGVVFKVNTDGTGFSVLHEFDFTNGAWPYAGVVVSAGKIYGITYYGGSGTGGVVYSLATDGSAFTVLRELDEDYPQGDLLLIGSTLYGTTAQGGGLMGSMGSVFKIQTDGSGYVLLHAFTDLAMPVGSLIASGTTLYGTTSGGGTYNKGTVFSIETDGSGFATLYSFTGGADGRDPEADLFLSGTTLYGLTSGGGDINKGVLFSLETDGSGFSRLASFGGALGANPTSTPILLGNTLYGTTSAGGETGSAGTIFRFGL